MPNDLTTHAADQLTTHVCVAHSLVAVLLAAEDTQHTDPDALGWCLQSVLQQLEAARRLLAA
ncbi:MAG: hypothetical protein WBK26_12145 [Burkholderiaceae bacterium]